MGRTRVRFCGPKPSVQQKRGSVHSFVDRVRGAARPEPGCILPRMRTDFRLAFTDGQAFRAEPPTSVRIHRAGDLILPSGRIVACDPLVMPGTSAFTREVVPGRYPVLLSIAQLEHDQRVAAAAVEFVVGGATIAARWDLAVIPGQDLTTLGPRQFFGYGVDAGTGCFMDARLAAALDAGEPCGLDAALQSSYVPTFSWANVELRDGSVVAFSSGWGDGSYASYWGFDATGRVVALATDFAVLVEGVHEIVRIDRVLDRANGVLEHPLLAAEDLTVSLERTHARLALQVRGRGSLDPKLVAPVDGRVLTHARVLWASGTSTYVFELDGIPFDAALALTVNLGVRPLVPA